MKVFVLTLLFSTSAFAESNIKKFFSGLPTGAYIGLTASQMVSPSLTDERINQTNPNDNGSFQYKMSGQRFSGALGYMISNVTIGLERSLGRLDYKYSNPLGTELRTADMDMFVDTAFLMYRGPTLVPWVGVIAGGNASDPANKVEFRDIVGSTVGLGYKITDWLQLSVQYNSYTFRTVIENGVTTSLPQENRKRISGKETLVNLTIAFESETKKSSGSSKK